MKLPRIRYSPRQALGDMSGGLIAALIALPYGLAMAALMGLPPVLGVFTSILTAPITALLGRNPVLIGGTSSVTVPFIAAAVRYQGAGGAAKVCLTAAVFMMIFSVLRLGRTISHVPQTVVSGFSCGIGGMMVISQLPTIFGVKVAQNGSMFDVAADVFRALGHMRIEPLLLAAVVIAVSAFLSPRWPRIPAPLVGVGLALAAATLAGLHEKEVGLLSLSLPPFAGFDWHPSDVYSVLPQGLGLAFVTSVNLLVTSRVVEHFRGRHNRLKKADADAELGAYSIANVCTGIFAAPISVGIPARSLALLKCGGSTRMANLWHAAILAAVLGLGSGVLSRVPLAALAGVTAYMGVRLLEWSTWRRLNRMRLVDSASFIVTAVASLAINAVAAIALGCAVCAAEWAYRKAIALSRIPPLQAEVKD